MLFTISKSVSISIFLVVFTIEAVFVWEVFSTLSKVLSLVEAIEIFRLELTLMSIPPLIFIPLVASSVVLEAFFLTEMPQVALSSSLVVLFVFVIS